MLDSRITPTIVNALAEQLDDRGRISADAVAEIFEAAATKRPAVETDEAALYASYATVLGIESEAVEAVADDAYAAWALASGVTS